MDLGFETIGNATLICHDGGPRLATDPWIEGPAYFGSASERTVERPRALGRQRFGRERVAGAARTGSATPRPHRLSRSWYARR